MGELFLGDCLEVLREFESDTIDSMVTDPPAGISFMGKSWDSDRGGRNAWVNNMQFIFKECHRVLKPGAHGLVWALPRTSHWTAWALEEAGFEIRDSVHHLFGSGFPKSLDVSKAIDKAAGAEREVISTRKLTGKARVLKGGNFDGEYEGRELNEEYAITAPSTDAAKQWQGFGTALKPAHEVWWLVRKPISEKTVAANVLKHGTGGINIDASRIETSEQLSQGASNLGYHGVTEAVRTQQNPQGRFPANVLFSHSPYCTDDQCDIECAVKELDRQSGDLGKSSGGGMKDLNKSALFQGSTAKNRTKACGLGDSGGASRFFATFRYCAKPSKRERNAGLEGMPDKQVATSNGAKAALARGEEYPHSTSGFEKIKTTKNTHPTVKPQKLMQYLIRMITPPGGTVLDPFMGSGSTGVAAKTLGFKFIGIEREAEYFEIAKRRIEREAK